MTSTDLVPVAQQSSFDLLPQAHELAKAIAQTEFVPSALRNRPEAVMACVLAGHEIGVGPMQSLQKIHIIEGRPGMAAELMRALILAAGHELWFEEKSSTKVTACGQRRGGDRVSKVTWTMDDAQKAGLAGKQNYRKIPRQMLTARATAELARDIFADVIGGFYAVEELQDGFVFDADTNGAAEPVEEPKTTRRRASRTTKKAAPVAAAPPPPSTPPLPPLPGEDEPDEGDIIDAEIVDEPIAPSPEDLGRRSQDVFDADYQAAPRGHKTKVIDRLRHAVAFVATKERAVAVSECTEEERVRVSALLRDIEQGRVTYAHDAMDDNAGVTFTLLRPDHPEGDKEVTVLWSQLERTEAAS